MGLDIPMMEQIYCQLKTKLRGVGCLERGFVLVPVLLQCLQQRPDGRELMLTGFMNDAQLERTVNVLANGIEIQRLSPRIMAQGLQDEYEQE